MILAQPAHGDITFISIVSGGAGNTYRTGSTLSDTSWTGTGRNQWIENNKVATNNGLRYIASSEYNDDATVPLELTTQITGLADGTYDIWVFFWDNIVDPASSQWVISAKLGDGAYRNYSTSRSNDVPGTTKVGVFKADDLTFTNTPRPTGTFSTIQELHGARIGQSFVSGGSTVNVYIGNFVDVALTGDQRTIYDGVGYQLVNSFAAWISDPFLGIDAGEQGLDDDPDGDGIANGVENFFGTHPGEFSHGLVADALSGNQFSFSHPANEDPATDLTATYRWSKDLATFTPGGESFGGTTVSFTASPPSEGFVTVTAEIGGTPVEKLFVDVQVALD